jgi:hypothetical protein
LGQPLPQFVGVRGHRIRHLGRAMISAAARSPDSIAPSM